MTRKSEPERDDRPLMTTAAVAARLGIDKCAKDPERMVLKMARRGDLVAITVGRYRMIVPASLDRYLDGR